METIQLYFYADIARGDAERTIEQLNSAPGAHVVVRINSPGGLVSEGLAIFNALKPRKPDVYIDGVAASIASLIAMSGGRIVAAENAMLMLHDPWGAAEGNASEFRRLADLLDMHRDAMVSAYLRSGQNREKVVALLNAETWLSASQAHALGFIDEISEPLRFAAHAPAAFAGFRNTPRSLLMSDPTPRQNPSNPGDSQTLEAFRSGLSSEPVVQATHDSVMANLQKANPAPTAPQAPAASSPVAAVVEERARVERIRASVAGLGYGAEIPPAIRAEVDRACSSGMSSEAFGTRLLSILGHAAEPLAGGGFREPKTGESDFIAAASDALVIRAGITLSKPHPGARDLRNLGIVGLASTCLSRAGKSHQSGGRFTETLRAAMTTSDFPALLENTVAKVLRNGYEIEPRTYEAWTRLVQVADLKPQSRVILGSAPELLSVLEGAEYEDGPLEEDKSLPYSVGKWGRIISLSWEAMRNDDVGGFLRVAQGLGQAAARAEADAVYAPFALNSGTGPQMQDGVVLFHADHANLTTSQAAVDAAALGAGRILLRRQTAVGGGVLNLPPKFLLVSPEHESAAEAVLAAAARGLSQGSSNQLVPAWLAALELIVEPRLTDDAIYLLTSPEVIDTFERAHLDGERVPEITEEDGFRTDTHRWKCRHTFGGRWLDWRGAVRIPIT